MCPHRLILSTGSSDPPDRHNHVLQSANTLTRNPLTRHLTYLFNTLNLDFHLFIPASGSTQPLMKAESILRGLSIPNELHE